MSGNPGVNRGLSRVIGGLGLVILAYGVYDDWVALRSVDWPATGGRILESSVLSHESKASLSYQAHITYRYQVEGRAMEGKGVHLHDHYSKNRGELQAWVDRFPAGSIATIHYEPGWPHRSVLVPGLTGDDSDYAVIMTGFGLTAIAWVASVSGRGPGGRGSAG